MPDIEESRPGAGPENKMLVVRAVKYGLLKCFLFLLNLKVNNWLHNYPTFQQVV